MMAQDEDEVKDSPKLLKFIMMVSWTYLPNPLAIDPVVDEVFQFERKWWTNRLTNWQTNVTTP